MCRLLPPVLASVRAASCSMQGLPCCSTCQIHACRHRYGCFPSRSIILSTPYIHLFCVHANSGLHTFVVCARQPTVGCQVCSSAAFSSQTLVLHSVFASATAAPRICASANSTLSDALFEQHQPSLIKTLCPHCLSSEKRDLHHAAHPTNSHAAVPVWQGAPLLSPMLLSLLQSLAGIWNNHLQDAMPADLAQLGSQHNCTRLARCPPAQPQAAQPALLILRSFLLTMAAGVAQPATEHKSTSLARRPASEPQAAQPAAQPGHTTG